MSDLLIFGRTGQVARALQHLAPLQAPGREAADLAQPGACAAAIHVHRPRAVINATAYMAVDRAEGNEALATAINGAAPMEIAVACAAMNIPLVHICTDYVFPGNGHAPWAPEDATAPANAYGRSKWAGKEGIRASGATHAILPTSWVFSAHGAKFAETMLRLSETRDAIGVVEDHIGGPTPARAIAAASLVIAQQLQDASEKTSTYHFSGAPDASWCIFARAIYDLTGRPIRVQGITSSAYIMPAALLLSSRLDSRSTKTTFDITRPDWRAALTDTLIELGGSN